MFTVYIENDGVKELLYDPRYVDDGYGIFSPSLELSIDTVGKFSFAVSVDHPLYSKFDILKTSIYVYMDNEVIFYGRVFNVELDFYNNKSVECEGMLNILKDVALRPFFEYELNGVNRKAITQEIKDKYNAIGFPKVENAFQYVITKVYDYAETGSIASTIRPGNVDDAIKTGTSKLNIIAIVNEDYTTLLEFLTSAFSDKYGGYFALRKVDNLYYVDWKAYNVSDISVQDVKFGINLLDLNRVMNADDVYSVLIAKGGDGNDGNGNSTGSITLKDKLMSKIDGADITSQAYVGSSGAITISKVTGNIEIEASATYGEFRVFYTIKNCDVSNNVTGVISGGEYRTGIYPFVDTKKELVKVTMGRDDITSECYDEDNNYIHIPEVTADLHITAIYTDMSDTDKIPISYNLGDGISLDKQPEFVWKGDMLTFEYKIASGYEVVNAYVTIDGKNIDINKAAQYFSGKINSPATVVITTRQTGTTTSHSITYHQNGGITYGSSSPSSVADGGRAVITFTLAKGYTIEEIYYISGGIKKNVSFVGNTITITNITTNIDFYIRTKGGSTDVYHNFTVVKSPGVTIVSAPSKVKDGDSTMVEVRIDTADYNLTSYYYIMGGVRDNPSKEGNLFLIGRVTADTELHIETTPKESEKLTISYAIDPGAYINPQPATGNRGETFSFNVTCDDDYKIDEIYYMQNGTKHTESAIFDFVLNYNTTIYVKASRKEDPGPTPTTYYTITYNLSGTDCNITQRTVEEGATLNIHMTPQSGYQYASSSSYSVTMGGSSVPMQSGYIWYISSVTGDIVITGSSSVVPTPQPTYVNVSYSLDSHTHCSTSTRQVPLNSSFSCSIYPDDGYEISGFGVTMSGSAIQPSGVYSWSIPNVTGDISIYGASKEVKYYTVTYNLTGTTPSTYVSRVKEGDSFSVSLTAQSGYRLGNYTVTMGGSTVSGSNYSWSIGSVTGNIVVSGSAIRVYNISYGIPSTASKSSSATTIAEGSSWSCTVICKYPIVASSGSHGSMPITPSRPTAYVAVFSVSSVSADISISVTDSTPKSVSAAPMMTKMAVSTLSLDDDVADNGIMLAASPNDFNIVTDTFDGYTVSFKLDHVTSTNTEILVGKNSVYKTELKPEDGYRIDISTVKIKMGAVYTYYDKDYVYSQDLVDLYGWIERVVTWNDITDPDELYSKADSELSNILRDNISLTVRAIDKSSLIEGENRINLGDSVRIISTPHHIDALYPCTSIRYDLVNPADSEFTFNMTQKKLTETLGVNNKYIQDQIDANNRALKKLK